MTNEWVSLTSAIYKSSYGAWIMIHAHPCSIPLAVHVVVWPLVCICCYSVLLLNHKSTETTQTSTNLHGLDWGDVACFSHGKGFKVWTDDDGRISIRFRILIEVQESNFVDTVIVFLDIIQYPIFI